MPVFTSSIELSDDYPSIQPSLNLNFARARALDPRITFTRASVGTYVGRDGLIKTAGNNEARFDHDPDTLESLGLLIEEGRTNYVNNSTNPNWFSVASAVNETTYPIKGLATTRLTDSPSDGDSPYLGAANWGTGSSIPMCISIYVDAVNSTSDTITLYLFGAGYIAHSWNISTGVPVATESFSINGSNYNSGSQEVIDCGGGIYRLILKANYTGTTTTTARYYLAPSGGATDYVIIAGPQIEQGAFPTSYIPTSGASATRAVDVAFIPQGPFAEIYNTEESTVLMDVRANVPVSVGNQRNMFHLGNDNSDGFGFLKEGGGLNKFFHIRSGGSTLTNFDSGVDFPYQTTVKFAAAFTSGDQAMYFDDVLRTSTTDTSGLNQSAITIWNIGASNSQGANPLTGTISKMVYYPKRLTNAQLQLLTS